MANSVVKVTDMKDDHLSESLVLLIGADGTVTPDQKTVESYLSKLLELILTETIIKKMFIAGKRNCPTNLQIMKINKSEKQNIDITIDNVTYMPDVVNEGNNFLV